MAFVQGAHNSISASSASLTATFGAGVTSGNTVWGIVAWNGTSGAPTSITVGGVAATILDTVNDVADAASLTSFILGNISGAPTAVVANFSPNQAFIGLIAVEESGCLAASNPTDVHTGRLQSSPGTGANIINSGNVTTTVASDIIVGGYCDAVGSTTGTAGTSPLAFTLRTTDNGAGEPVTTEDTVVLVTPGTAAATFGQLANDSALSIVIAIKPAGGAAVADTPAGFKGGYWPSRWTRNAFLLHNRRAGPEFSIAPETNTHFVPRAFPLQWNRNPFLLHNRRAGPEASSAPETNPHWAGKSWPRQWNINDSPNLLWNSAGDVPLVVVVDTPTTFVPLQWQSQWNVDVGLVHGGAADAPPASPAADTPASFIPRILPAQWNINLSLKQNTAQDFSSSAVETNPQWRSATWPRQWNINDSPNLIWNAAGDVPVVVSVDTPQSFIPRTWPRQWFLDYAPSLLWNPADDGPPVIDSPPPVALRTWPPQWILNRILVLNTAQDFNSSAVETNVYFSPHPWPLQWLTYKALWQNPATDAQVVVIPPDAPTYFVPVQFPWQWVINLLLTTSPANDLTSPAIETNPQWTGRTYPKQWQAQPFLWHNPATDAPIVVAQSDTPSYFAPRQFPPQWAVNRSLGRGTAQDFSSSAVDTPSYHNPQAWPPQWSAKWNLNVRLTQGTAQDFSSTAPVQTVFEWLIRARRRGRR